MLAKVRRDSFPKIVPAQYMHKKGTDTRNLSDKCSRSNEEIIMMQNKKIRDKKYIR